MRTPVTVLALSTVLLMACPAETPPDEAASPTGADPAAKAPAPAADPGSAPKPASAPAPANAPTEAAAAADPAKPPADEGEAPEAKDAPEAEPAVDPAELEKVRVKDPYALPTGGGVEDLGQKIETVRQLIDRIATLALRHEARMSGQETDVDGKPISDLGKEKSTYLEAVGSTYEQIRTLMVDVAQCDNKSTTGRVGNSRAPIQIIGDQIDRYKSARPKATEATKHIEKLRAAVVELKSVYVQASPDFQQKDPKIKISPKVKANWCVN